MPLATIIAPRGGGRGPGRLPLFAATAVLAVSAPALAGAAEDGPVIRDGSAALRLAVPYQAGKVPVVFVHGLLGSPGSWSVMIDHLSTDPTVRAHFQFLTFRYDSLQSIPESGLQLLEALDEARRRFDPEGRDPSFDRVVLVGHSLGGLVAKAAARAPDPPPSGAVDPPPGGQGRPVTPRVGRVIFVATPHRGTAVDRGAVQSVGSWFARAVSPSFAAQRARGIAGAGGPGTSVDQLAWDHPLLADLERAGAAAEVPFHSIIAALCEPSARGATDGIVPVVSARLGNARSEVVVRTHHLCCQHPEVIREVRRVLIEHAAPPTRPPRSEPWRSPSVTSLGACQFGELPLCRVVSPRTTDPARLAQRSAVPELNGTDGAIMILEIPDLRRSSTHSSPPVTGAPVPIGGLTQEQRKNSERSRRPWAGRVGRTGRRVRRLALPDWGRDVGVSSGYRIIRVSTLSMEYRNFIGRNSSNPWGSVE
jgi:pimeloyl-ACP methyl ester carboxylesterase